MSAILVTGGAGFIGANFVRLLLKETAHSVVVLDKLTYAGNLASLREVESDPRYSFVRGDIADSGTVEDLVRRFRPSSLINFAAESHVDRSIDDPSPFLETNVRGTFVLLETARQYWREMDGADRAAFTFLHVSTDEVYGSLGDGGLFSEMTPYAPNSPYAASKAAADHLVRAWHETYGLPTRITNCSNNYGPFQFPEKLIPLTILNLAEGKPVPIYGDGGNVRDWLYVEDHCAGILLALEKGKPGEKYNIGGAGERRNIEVVDRICAELESALPAAANPALQGKGITRYSDLKTFVPDRPGHDRRYAIDAAKIGRELGWTAKHDFDSAIAKTVRWYLENRGWCEEVTQNKYERQRLGLDALSARK